ncbi:hypothetical protein OY671_008587, partial [Metschnikowia pulcherrima]
SVGSTGEDSYTIKGVADRQRRQDVEVEVTRPDGATVSFTASCRIDTANEVEYFMNGGISHYAALGSAKRRRATSAAAAAPNSRTIDGSGTSVPSDVEDEVSPFEDDEVESEVDEDVDEPVDVDVDDDVEELVESEVEDEVDESVETLPDEVEVEESVSTLPESVETLPDE